MYIHVLGKSRVFNTEVLMGTSSKCLVKQDIQHQSACQFKQGFMVVLLMLVYGKLLALVQVKRGGCGSESQSDQ